MANFEDLSLPALFVRVKESLKELDDAPPGEASQLQAAAAAVGGAVAAARAAAAVDSLGLFSPNEEADDIATRDLKYLLLPFYRGELAAASRDRDPEACADALRAAASYHRAFLQSIRTYGLLGSEARPLVEALEDQARGGDEGPSTSSSNSLARPGPPGRLAGGGGPDAAALRAQKIARFKREKWLAARLAVLEAERRGGGGEGEDAEAWEGGRSSHAEERERELWLLQIEQAALQAADRLKSLEQEAALLRHAAALPREQRGAAAGQQRAGGDAALPPAMLAKLREAAGALAGASDTARRQKLREQVLRPSHVLPTMTVEQWGEVEYRMAMERQHREAEASERAAEEAADEDKALAKQRAWDDWLDDNPRGWGNSKLRPCG